MKHLMQLPFKKLFKGLIMYFKKICAITVKQTIMIGTAAAIISTAITGVNIIVDTHYRSIGISLNYDGAQHGLTPSQGRFDIEKIKSDEVISAAIEKTGDKSLTVENVRPRITIDANMPKSAVDKTVSEISNGRQYSYTPAEFVIYYGQKNKFGKNYTVDFLNALAESYKDFFASTYSDKNTVLEFSNTSEYENEDYDEICEILSDKTNSMINYLGQEQDKAVDFVSNDTGCRYSDLITSLVNIRDISIEKLSAYIQQNQVSKNKNTFLNKKKHLIDSEMRNYDYLNGASNISNASLKIYDARISGVAFVPTVDEENEFYMSRTKTGLDNLSKMSYQNGKKAADLKKTIDEYQEKYNKFQNAAESTEEMHQNAELMIDDIEKSLRDVSELAIRTDNEYITKKNNNYLSISTPEKYSPSIIGWIKYFVLLSIIMVVGLRLLRIAKHVIQGFADKENDKNESKAG